MPIARVGALCVLVAALSGCAKAPAARAPSLSPLSPLQQLSQDLEAATMVPGVRRAAWGIAVHSIDRDERMFELNPGTLLVPASAAKLISLASAADAVGWEFRFETRVVGTGPLVDGTLHGDLVIVGSGDPSIGGRGGPDVSSWVRELQALGLRAIEGRIIGDDDRLEEPRPQLAWAWDDLGYQTGALFGALNQGENQTTITISPAAEPGVAPMLAFEPQGTFREIRNRVATGPAGSPQLLWPEQRPGEPSLTIAGSIPVGASPVRLPVAVGNPTAWFASSVRAALIGGGIDVTGGAYDIDDLEVPPDRAHAALLHTFRSPPLAEIAAPMMKESINLYAEAALRLNAAQDEGGTNDAALEGLRARLTAWGIAAESWQIVDGSGLSRRNAVAPDALLAVLRRMYEPSGASPWMAALPVAGRDGTLAGRMRGTPAENNVRAKTGTMSNIRSLAGYVRTHDGETLAFVLMAHGFEGLGGTATDALDRIAIRLASFSRERSARR